MLEQSAIAPSLEDCLSFLKQWTHGEQRTKKDRCRTRGDRGGTLCRSGAGLRYPQEVAMFHIRGRLCSATIVITYHSAGVCLRRKNVFLPGHKDRSF